MSVADINREKLNALRHKLAASQDSSFEDNLKAVFDPHGHRQAGTSSVWLLRISIFI